MQLLIVFLLFASTVVALPNDLPALTGRVLDAVTGEPLGAVNVRVFGTSRGTITNSNGRFVLALESGDQRVVFTSLGYASDTITVHLADDVPHDVRLKPSDIVLPEMIVTSEDPAIEIIRRAIANKQRWIDRLKSYKMQAFTRQTVYRDTAVASVTESYTTGYWQQGDTLREIITQQRQTANVPSAFNFASVGRLINFAEDEIRFFGYEFVGPTARDALDYYDYKLFRTRSDHGQDLFEIRMIPRTRTVPLFEGTVIIAGESYALVGVDVTPNVAFKIPFVNVGKLRYRQQFGLYESTFWMPADIRIEGKFTIGFVGISIPPIAFVQTSVISEYAINVALPDSIFRKPRLTVDSSATRYDSAYWAAHTVLPPTPDEEQAYRTLDSSQTLDVQFRPGGAAMTFGGDGGIGRILSIADVHFNRVEGFHLGAHVSLDTLAPQVSGTAGLAYGTADKVTTYSFGATFFTSPRRVIGIGGEVYRRVDHSPDQGYYGPLFNSITSLVSRNDYRDYHLAEGVKGFVAFRPSGTMHADLSYVSETEDAMIQNTDYSFFNRSGSYRINPGAASGKLQSLKLWFRLGPDPIPFDLVLRNSLELFAEHSSPGFTGGDFRFTRYEGVLSLTIPTFGQSYLLKPGFRVRLSAGGSSGTLPIQRWFNVETASGSFAPLGVMRAMEVKEYAGTGYMALNVEHNFRSIPFLALGIPFLYESNIELIVHAGGARTWSQGIAMVSNTTDGWYSEAGFSISRIFDLFRADFTWRITQPGGFRFTFGAAGLF